MGAPAFGSARHHHTGEVVGRAAFTTARKSGASGEIRTLKHLFLRQATIPRNLQHTLKTSTR
jgi:hypothetical protein